MDKLEQTKTANASNDAVTDDLAGQAYVEQFAQETFDRAQRTLKADKVTQCVCPISDTRLGDWGIC